MAHIDVLMPVKNGARTIGPAIDSILEQSFRDLRLIITDDHSTDETSAIVEKYSERDGRVMLTRSAGVGIAAARNHCLANSSAPYVAQLDSDDLMLRSRLERQLAFLKERPHVAVVGARGYFFGERNTGCTTVIAWSEECRQAMGLFNPVGNSSVLMRREALDRLGRMFSWDFPYAEDYEFYSRLIHVGDICALEEPLFCYRVHKSQVSQQRRTEQRQSAFRIAARYISETYGIDPNSKFRVLAVMTGIVAKLGPARARQSAHALRDAILTVSETKQ